MHCDYLLDGNLVDKEEAVGAGKGVPGGQTSLALDDHAHIACLDWLEVNLMMLDDKLFGLLYVGIILGCDTAKSLAIGDYVCLMDEKDVPAFLDKKTGKFYSGRKIVPLFRTIRGL